MPEKLHLAPVFGWVELKILRTFKTCLCKPHWWVAVWLL